MSVYEESHQDEELNKLLEHGDCSYEKENK